MENVLGWKENRFMVREPTMWRKFWTQEKQATGGVGIWEEARPYTGKEGSTVVIRDYGDIPICMIYDLSDDEAEEIAEDIMKTCGTGDLELCAINICERYGGEVNEPRAKKVLEREGLWSQ